MMIMLLGNLSEVVETVKNVIDAREAMLGWIHANYDVAHAVADAHRTACATRAAL